MILGLDISTSKVGLAILNEKEEIILSEFLKLNSKDSLERRAQVFHKHIYHLTMGEKIDAIYVEEPFVSFQGGSNAKTVAILQRFNGMCCYAIYHFTGIIPTLLNANSVRSQLGIKIPRGKKNKREKKKPIIDFVLNKYPEFRIEYTKQGNPAPGTDDKCDAICLALAGPNFPLTL